MAALRHRRLPGRRRRPLDGGTDRLAVHPAAARVASIAAAGTATRLLNRLITFPSRSGRRRVAEWPRYLAVNGVGAGVNYRVFVTAVAAVPAITPIGALAVASLVALPINFLGSRHDAFRGENPR